MLQILGRDTSINVRKVLWACAELNLPFEREDWGGDFRSTREPEYVALNPNSLVPVVKDGDFVMWESNAILRYLANCYDDSKRMYPLAPRERFAVDRWIDWQASDLNNACRYPFLSLVRKSPEHQSAEQLSAACATWSRLMRIVDQQLSRTGAYMSGPDFTIADIPIGLVVNRWFGTPVPGRVELPAVQAYFERLKAREGFRRLTEGRAP